MENTTGMATKYLLDMLNIGGKSENNVGAKNNTETKPPEKVEEGESVSESASVTSSSMASPLSQTKAMSDMSLSVGEIPGFLDGSTPRISLHPVTQTIQLTGDSLDGSKSVFGNQVEIVSSQNTSSNITSSNKIKINQMVKYDWDLKYYRGNLIALGSQFIAYTLKGRTGYVVRLLNPQTASRALLKGFTGLVTDLAFAHRDSSTLACVDEGGNIYVWNIREQGDKIEYKVKLHVKRSPSPISEYHRIFWCPYLPDDDDDEEEEQGDDKPDDFDDRSLAVTHDNQAEVIDVAMIVARCGCSEVDIDMLERGEGYVSIIDGHNKPITDGSLSPDNAVLATASEDGYVKFWQVGDMMPEGDHKCLHGFQPHDGAPLASLAFCDNHVVHEKDVPMWRFMITGAEYNRELKVWCTVEWTCLQTLRFTSPTADIASVLGGSYFKIQLDATARYLVLSDIGRRVLYVLLVHQDRSEGRAHVSSITDFQLTQPLLSFVITKSKLFKLKSSDQLVQENGNADATDEVYDAENPDELDESELDSLEKRKNLMLQLRLYSIHTKSLQELLIHLQPEPSVPPPTPTIISSLNTSIGHGVRDALSDVSCETRTETSTDMDESDGTGSDISASSKPKLIAPDAFTHTSKDPSRPESNASNVSSGTLVSALEASQNSAEDSVMSSVTSKLSDSTKSSFQEAAASQNFHGQSSGVLTPTSLPLPGTPPFSMAPDPTAIPIPTFKSSPMSSINNDNMSKQSPRVASEGLDHEVEVKNKEQESENDDRASTPVVEITVKEKEQVEVQSPSSVGKDPIAVTKISKSESNESDEHSGDDAAENTTPVEGNMETTMDSTWMTAIDSQTPREQMPRMKLVTSTTRKAALGSSLVSTPVSNFEIPPQSPRQQEQDLSSSLSELLQLLKSQQTQILSLRQEVSSYQTHSRQNISELVRGEVEKLEDTILERVNGGLAQHSIEEHQRLEKALRERQTADKKKQEQLTSTLSQAVTNSISGKIDKTVKNEMKNNVIPAVQKVLTPVQEQLNTTMTQKLTAADAVLKDSINKMVKNKGVVESIGSSAANALQGPIQDTYRGAFQNTILPAFERACQSMFQQINEAFQKGTHQYLEKVTVTLESQKRDEREAIDPAIDQLQSKVQLLRSECQRNNSNLIRDVESILQKQLATALHNLREEIMSRFETQIKVSVQETVKAEVQQALQEVRQTCSSVPVSETVPPQPSVDHKKRIIDLIQVGQTAQAFQEALTAADLNLVVFVCESVDSNELFSQTNASPLSQPVLLSLIQQLSVDLLSNTELKHRYLTEAVMLLDPSNEVTREHMPAVLQGLCQQLNYAINECSGPTQRNLRMLLMAAKSLLR